VGADHLPKTSDREQGDPESGFDVVHMPAL
jgi:hypothetical protein